MGKLVSTFFIALDGVVESPEQWHFPYFNDEMGASMTESTNSAAFLMGRTLYDQWSSYWPQQNDTVPFASFINTVPKYVISSTVTDPQWHATTVLPGDPAAVRAVKESTDGEIHMSGSATTVRWLVGEGLLDELHLLVHPIAVGHGQRLFEGTTSIPLTLVNQRAFGTGVLDVTYTPA